MTGGLDLFTDSTTLAERAASNFGVLKQWAEIGDRLGVVDVLAEIHAEQQWKVLGHDSFQSACREIIGGVPLLERTERQETVVDLANRGLSTRAIASALGVAQSTVVADQKVSGEQNRSPETTGLDGKTYTRRTTVTETAPADPFAGWSKAERDALADFQSTRRSLVVNMSSTAPVGARIWAWAERNGRAVRIDRRTDWGNPFILGEDGDRAEVIARFAEHYLPYKPGLLAALPELKGKILGCWCAPLACHGHVLVAEAYS